MKIKLDENLPGPLADDLRALGHDVDTVDTVIDEGRGGQPDPRIWIGARSSNRLLITQDLDFSDIRQFEPGTHAGLLLVRLRQPGRGALRARIAQLFQDEDVEAWSRAFVVATDRKLRVREPPSETGEGSLRT